jgi:peptide/nickel transport system permease protein
MTATTLADTAVAPTRRRRDAWLWLLNSRLAVGAVIVATFTVAAFVLPVFASVDPSAQSSYMKNLPISPEHLLGTNSLGQDIFWLLIFSIRNSLILGIIVAVGVTIVSTIVGLSAGFIGGNFERLVMLVVDTFITIPLLPLLIMLGALIRANQAFLVLSIIIFGWAWAARTVRSMVLSLREREFINMARFSGANTTCW